MDNEILKIILGVLGGVGATLVSLLGGGKLVQMFVNRKWVKQDKTEEVHVTVESKKIDQDQHAFDAMMKRLDSLESEQALTRAEIKELNKQLTEAMTLNSRLEAENKALQENNTRQQGEIDRLRDRIKVLDERLETRESQIISFVASLQESKDQLAALRAELMQTTQELNRAKAQREGKS